MSITTPGASAQASSYTYNVDGQVETVLYGTTTLADPSYTSGLLGSVAYSNGTSLGSIIRNATGASTGFTWSFPSQASVSDGVVRSQSGRILQDTLTDGTTAGVSTYSYDTAGRLVTAVIPGHTRTYGFGATTGCTNNVAGKDGDRTAFTDVHGSTTTSTSYCYDYADELTSTTVTGSITGADPVASTNLASTGTSPSLVYDAHGNTIQLADESLVYDVANQHTKTTLADGTVLTYLRDATGRVVQRTMHPPTGSDEVERYTYGPSGEYAVLDGSNMFLSRTVSLPGGASVTISSSSSVWSYSNLHGDSIVTATNSGTRTGAVCAYDPFGQPIDPVTGNIGTTTADDAVPDTQPGDSDFGWVGSAGKQYEHAGDDATIEMGARLYVAALGRFLEVDPVVGANSNSYNYPNDPIDVSDVSGEKPADDGVKFENLNYVLKFVTTLNRTIAKTPSSSSSVDWNAVWEGVAIAGLVLAGVAIAATGVGLIAEGVAAGAAVTAGAAVEGSAAAVGAESLAVGAEGVGSAAAWTSFGASGLGAATDGLACYRGNQLGCGGVFANLGAGMTGAAAMGFGLGGAVVCSPYGLTAGGIDIYSYFHK